ncbi:MAG: hypothetical protein NTV46_21680 [Verrucomicrobia bacterium]|nr:hypothetical protein [Verrucomicrobiota bacterium]
MTDKSAWPDLGKYVKDVVGMFMDDKRGEKMMMKTQASGQHPT